MSMISETMGRRGGGVQSVDRQRERERERGNEGRKGRRDNGRKKTKK
jgi:hypothetical protein